MFFKFLDEASEDNRKAAFNGFTVLQFRSNNDLRFVDGLKTGKCIELIDDNIREVTGTFVNDTLQVNEHYKTLEY